VETDPIKRALEEIDQELEDAMSMLSDKNQRVDDLLNDYSAGTLEVPAREARASADIETDVDDDADTSSGVEISKDSIVEFTGDDAEDEFDDDDDDEDYDDE